MKTPKTLAALCVLVCVSMPVHAGIDIDLSGSVRIGDNADLFFGITSRYFDRDRDTVQHWGARYRNPDDLAVALFISRHTGKSLDVIHRHRHDGASWWEVSLRYGMPADVWFVPVPRTPGPPYGKAYGYWKKHKHDRHQTIVLTDGDVRNLVAVRMLHEYYRVPVDVAMQWRSSGKTVQALATDEYHKRHGKGHDASTAKSPGRSAGKGNGKNKRK